MKAIVLHEYGPAKNLQYEDVPDPIPAEGEEVLIRLAATSVNPIDYKVRSGAYKERYHIELPIILGRDTFSRHHPHPRPRRHHQLQTSGDKKSSPSATKPTPNSSPSKPPTSRSSPKVSTSSKPPRSPSSPSPASSSSPLAQKSRKARPSSSPEPSAE